MNQKAQILSFKSCSTGFAVLSLIGSAACYYPVAGSEPSGGGLVDKTGLEAVSGEGGDAWPVSMLLDSGSEIDTAGASGPDGTWTPIADSACKNGTAPDCTDAALSDELFYAYKLPYGSTLNDAQLPKGSVPISQRVAIRVAAAYDSTPLRIDYRWNPVLYKDKFSAGTFNLRGVPDLNARYVVSVDQTRIRDIQGENPLVIPAVIQPRDAVADIGTDLKIVSSYPPHDDTLFVGGTSNNIPPHLRWQLDLSREACTLTMALEDPGGRNYFSDEFFKAPASGYSGFYMMSPGDWGTLIAFSNDGLDSSIGEVAGTLESKASPTEDCRLTTNDGYGPWLTCDPAQPNSLYDPVGLSAVCTTSDVVLSSQIHFQTSRLAVDTGGSPSISVPLGAPDFDVTIGYEAGVASTLSNYQVVYRMFDASRAPIGTCQTENPATTGLVTLPNLAGMAFLGVWLFDTAATPVCANLTLDTNTGIPPQPQDLTLEADLVGLGVCGDGAVTGGETCDDGVANNGTCGYCDATCGGPTNTCGDGAIACGEFCDDGVNNGYGDGYCLSDCSAVQTCGDAIVNGTELCDDGANNGTLGYCTADCSCMTSGTCTGAPVTEQLVFSEVGSSGGITVYDSVLLGYGLPISLNQAQATLLNNAQDAITQTFTTQGQSPATYYVWVLGGRASSGFGDGSFDVQVDGQTVGTFSGPDTGGANGVIEWQGGWPVVLGMGTHEITITMAASAQFAIYDGAAVSTNAALDPQANFTPLPTYDLDNAALDLFTAGAAGSPCCGDCVINGQELCDDGLAAGDGFCLATCMAIEQCGNGKTEGTETCDDGALNGQPNQCDPTCTGITPPVCGNGILESGEYCDDGDLDPCTADCNATCTGVYSYCNDGIVDIICGEVCDDGNTDNGSPNHCNTSCTGITPSVCGNGVLEAGEACDDNNYNDCDNCSPDCTYITGYCGDGIVDPRCNETCDDGLLNGTPGYCAATCYELLPSPACGDGIVQFGEVCDDGNTLNCAGNCRSDCRAAITGCGDAIVCPPEVCDDGPGEGEGLCSDDCSGWQQCGNGIITGSEVCDDGGSNGTLGNCSSDCRNDNLETDVCGDGKLSGSEECDDGNGDDGDACTNSCHLAICGDGILWRVYEECDDGNTSNNDGCLNNCEQAICGDAYARTDLSCSKDTDCAMSREKCVGGQCVIGCDCPAGFTCSVSFPNVCRDGSGIASVSGPSDAICKYDSECTDLGSICLDHDGDPATAKRCVKTCGCETGYTCNLLNSFCESGGSKQLPIAEDCDPGTKSSGSAIMLSNYWGVNNLRRNTGSGPDASHGSSLCGWDCRNSALSSCTSTPNKAWLSAYEICDPAVSQNVPFCENRCILSPWSTSPYSANNPSGSLVECRIDPVSGYAGSCSAFSSDSWTNCVRTYCPSENACSSGSPDMTRCFTVTQVLGEDASLEGAGFSQPTFGNGKFDIVVAGDGFQADELDFYRDSVRRFYTEGLYQMDPFRKMTGLIPGTPALINIFRIDAISRHTGVSVDDDKSDIRSFWGYRARIGYKGPLPVGVNIPLLAKEIIPSIDMLSTFYNNTTDYNGGNYQGYPHSTPPQSPLELFIHEEAHNWGLNHDAYQDDEYNSSSLYRIGARNYNLYPWFNGSDFGDLRHAWGIFITSLAERYPCFNADVNSTHGRADYCDDTCFQCILNHLPRQDNMCICQLSGLNPVIGQVCGESDAYSAIQGLSPGGYICERTGCSVVGGCLLYDLGLYEGMGAFQSDMYMLQPSECDGENFPTSGPLLYHTSLTSRKQKQFSLPAQNMIYRMLMGYQPQSLHWLDFTKYFPLAGFQFDRINIPMYGEYVNIPAPIPAVVEVELSDDPSQEYQLIANPDPVNSSVVLDGGIWKFRWSNYPPAGIFQIAYLSKNGTDDRTNTARYGNFILTINRPSIYMFTSDGLFKTSDSTGSAGSDLSEMRYLYRTNPSFPNSSVTTPLQPVLLPSSTTSYGFQLVASPSEASLTALWAWQPGVQDYDFDVYDADGIAHTRTGFQTRSGACSTSFCGNGVLDTNCHEECDDGNLTNGDGCDQICYAEQCGNGIVGYMPDGLGGFIPEVCDHGTLNGSSGYCSSTCSGIVP